MARAAALIGHDHRVQAGGDDEEVLERQPLGQQLATGGDGLDRHVGIQRAEPPEHVIDGSERVPSALQRRCRGCMQHDAPVHGQRRGGCLAHEIVDERERFVAGQQAGTDCGVQHGRQLWCWRGGELLEQDDVDVAPEQAGHAEHLELVGRQGEEGVGHRVAASRR